MTAFVESAGEIISVTHRYGDTIALDNLNLRIPAGCMVGLIGPDGVGKSTLLALIAGVRKLQDGDVTTLGGSMRDKNHRRACVSQIAYMPQGLGKNLYPTLSIQENLDFFGRLFGQKKVVRSQRIEELVSATGLAPFVDRPAGKLSGGMKQKLGLCCALIHDPDLLILDEPTTGVDPLSRRQFWELIDQMRRRRPSMNVIVATAYMEEAERFDWLAAMDEGKIIATGTPDQHRLRTETNTLEDAFIALLPAEKQKKKKQIVVHPRSGEDGEIAIRAMGLTKRFGDFVAVDHVSFEIERGEIFGFLGSNGCGKTTTMKMLTGLQPATEGQSELFGKPLNARDMKTRRRVGYMSQSFSLYKELTVYQNIKLHAHIFQIPAEQAEGRVEELLNRFELSDVREQKPGSLPIGVKQRLQLAVALLHKPELLILDEPTSGVDPIARDEFWRHLLELSRDEGVTIFISTHFMNEAERCDRISLMHAGKVLAVGAPADLVKTKKAASLDDAFVSYLMDEIGEAEDRKDQQELVLEEATVTRSFGGAFEPRRMWAYTVRETKELLRDPIRLAFALLGPIILMVTFGYGISFDVEDLPYAVLDQDQTVESRELLENFSGSRYFTEHGPISNPTNAEFRLKSGELKFTIEIPAGFGKNMQAGQVPEVGIWLDGAMPFRAETARGYIQGVTAQYLSELSLRQYGVAADGNAVRIETRFLYNQAFKSTYAITPGVIMLLCILIPAMMTAVGIVREKEMGSITNFYATPVTSAEFLLGKQLPYIALAYLNFLSLLLLISFLFEVPLKGSFLALSVGALAYVWTTTGFGMLISSFVKSQIAAIFATSIVAIVLTMNFSGFLTPVSTLGGVARFMSLLFPAPYFQQISVGSITKALGFAELWPNHLALIGFAAVFFIAAALLVRKQEL